jgi:hypothetical protein
MTVGTLRDQVIYPDSHEEQIRKGSKDAELADILNKVQLVTIVQWPIVSMLPELSDTLNKVHWWRFHYVVQCPIVSMLPELSDTLNKVHLWRFHFVVQWPIVSMLPVW